MKPKTGGYTPDELSSIMTKTGALQMQDIVHKISIQQIKLLKQLDT